MNQQKAIVLKYFCLSDEERDFIHAQVDRSRLEELLNKYSEGMNLDRVPRAVLRQIMRENVALEDTSLEVMDSKFWLGFAESLSKGAKRPPKSLINLINSELGQ